MRRDRGGAIFLDTTYILPFFGVELAIPEIGELGRVLGGYDEIHFSEASVLEAKAKLLRLAVKEPGFDAAFRGFGENLDILRGDKKVIFHEYRGSDDRYFNLIGSLGLKLDFLDRVIVAQAVPIGRLMTEDGRIHALRKDSAFLASEDLKNLQIFRLGDALDAM
ncbi:MAG: hypothetical protein Q8O47_08240 [Candidatus Bathyarchaeota archaeon]|nr:hypothetical protein [Candidatus Bathyarchaeota archaeon]